MMPRRLIIAARNALGLTQAEFARECGMGRSTLARIETGHDRLSDAMTERVSRVIERALREIPTQTPQCPHGHPYDATNTYVASDGTRHCRACHRETNRACMRAKRSDAA